MGLFISFTGLVLPLLLLFVLKAAPFWLKVAAVLVPLYLLPCVGVSVSRAKHTGESFGLGVRRGAGWARDLAGYCLAALLAAGILRYLVL